MTSQKPPAVNPAVLLVGHGTRDPRGQAEFLELARLIAERLPRLPVRPAYLELADPNLSTAIDELMSMADVQRLYVLPLLLFAAGHAKRDIPQAVAAALARHRGVESVQLPHLGTHPAVAELSALRMEETLAGKASISSDETYGVLVGRGSYDSDAQAEWRDLAASRRETTTLGQWAECFLAMAKPTPEELLPNLLLNSWRRIVWQPHLLFHGELMDRVREFVASESARDPGREWLVTSHLGADPRLADAAAEIVAAAGVEGTPGG